MFIRERKLAFPKLCHGEYVSYDVQKGGIAWTSIKMTFLDHSSHVTGILYCQIRSAAYESFVVFPCPVEESGNVDIGNVTMCFERGDKRIFDEDLPLLVAHIGNLLMSRFSKGALDCLGGEPRAAKSACNIKDVYTFAIDAPYVKQADLSREVPVTGVVRYWLQRPEIEFIVTSFGIDPFSGGMSNGKVSSFDVEGMVEGEYPGFRLIHPRSWFFSDVSGSELECSSMEGMWATLNGGDSECVLCIVEMHGVSSRQEHIRAKVLADVGEALSCWVPGAAQRKSQSLNDMYSNHEKTVFLTFAGGESGKLGALKLTAECSLSNPSRERRLRRARNAFEEIARSFSVA